MVMTRVANACYDGYSCDVGKNGSDGGSDDGGDRGSIIGDSDESYGDDAINDGVSVDDNNDNNDINRNGDEMCAVRVDAA